MSSPPILVTVTDGSFAVVFGEGEDDAAITDATGWIAQELQIGTGTGEAIRAEAHRLIDLAVATGRYPGYAPKAGAAECKRTLTIRHNAAKTTHHPRWEPGHRRSRFGGDPGR